MTTDAEKLAVMEGAIKHGKKVEGRILPNGAWRLHVCPTWDWVTYGYRLAPERKKAKVWVNVYPDCKTIHNTHEAAIVCSVDSWHPIAIAVPVEFEYEEGYGLEDRT